MPTRLVFFEQLLLTQCRNPEAYASGGSDRLEQNLSKIWSDFETFEFFHAFQSFDIILYHDFYTCIINYYQLSCMYTCIHIV